LSIIIEVHLNTDDPNEKRSQQRFNRANAIAYAFVNNLEHYVGLARDVSRDGMFFLTCRQLKPGTIVRIQPLDCQAPPILWGDGRCCRLAAAICEDPAPDATSRKDFANMVTAQVRRCEEVDENTPWRYGVGVSFMRPSV
jgi:hypothetical protein